MMEDKERRKRKSNLVINELQGKGKKT